MQVFLKLLRCNNFWQNKVNPQHYWKCLNSFTTSIPAKKYHLRDLWFISFVLEKEGNELSNIWTLLNVRGAEGKRWNYDQANWSVSYVCHLIKSLKSSIWFCIIPRQMISWPERWDPNEIIIAFNKKKPIANLGSVTLSAFAQFWTPTPLYNQNIHGL